MSVSLRTVLHGTFENIVRNCITSAATVLVMALVTTMFHGLLILYVKASKTLDSLQSKFSITVYLKDDSEPFEIGKLIKTIEQRRDVLVPVTYTSKEEAWKLMSESFGIEGDLLKRYSLSLPASITIRPRSPQDTPTIEAFLSTHAKKFLRGSTPTANAQKAITNRMVAFIDSVKSSTIHTILLFIIFFVIGGSLLMSSTIHIAFFARRREVSIMKLVGASKSRIMLPFVFEGLVLATFSFVLHLIFVSILPLASLGTQFHINVLLLEGVALLFLGGGVSYLTTLINLRNG